MKEKICIMLVFALCVATGLPSVSATATTLSTVEDEDIYVIADAYNYTSDDIKELLGLSLDENDVLYLSYYNWTGMDLGPGGVFNHTSVTPTKDSNDIVWFNIDLDINWTNRQIFFDDATITADNYDEAKTGLMINSSWSETEFVYIVTIPDDLEFTYEDYTYKYEDNNFTIIDEDGDEIGNISSWEYNSTYDVYAMNLTDDAKSHQLVVIGEELQATSTSSVGKRTTAERFWILPDSTTSYSMESEVTDGYNIYTSTDGYLAFDVVNDKSGWWGAQILGGKTEFKMDADTLQYAKSKYWGLSYDWTEITTHNAEIGGVDIGLIEYIYLSKDTGDEDSDEVLRDNHGVLTSRGSETSVSGLNWFRMGGTRTPEAVLSARTVSFL